MSSVIVCVGGANIDIRAKAAGQLAAHASNLGSVTVKHGGVARNVAEGVARLGLPSALVSAIGDDGFGRDIREGLGALGVDISMLRTIRGATTGSYVAMLDAEGEMSVAINAMDVMAHLTPEVLGGQRSKLRQARFVFADCNLPAETLRWLAQLGPQTIVDPVSPAKAARLRDLAGLEVSVITPNRYQAETLTGMTIANPLDALTAAQRLREMGFRRVMLSLGRDGAVAADEDVVHIPPEPQTGATRDVTGAGDAAIAGLILGLCQGQRFAQSCRMGQRAAARFICGGELKPELLS